MSEGPTIPEGWEQVPSAEKLRLGDMWWHPWSLKWIDYDGRYELLVSGDYDEDGSMAIRKKETTDAN